MKITITKFFKTVPKTFYQIPLYSTQNIRKLYCYYRPKFQLQPKIFKHKVDFVYFHILLKKKRLRAMDLLTSRTIHWCGVPAVRYQSGSVFEFFYQMIFQLFLLNFLF